MVIEGTYQFDRSAGGILVAPSATSFPVTPTAGEWLWRSDLGILYRRNDANTAWDTFSAVPSVSSVKAGQVLPGAFSGSPKLATVAFGSSFASTSYAITLSALTDGSRSFLPTVQSKTISGFTVNLNANNLAGLLEVGWHCTLSGS
jgi:hypothetical protein